MSQNRFFKQSVTLHVFLLVLLLIIGPAQSGWCFQDGDDITVPDTLLSSCHSIPKACLSATTAPGKQGENSDPFDCSECFDLTFEDIASTLLKNRNADIDFSPVLAFFQPQAVTSFDFVALHPLSPHLERSYKEGRILHHSIKSTVLII